MTNTMNNSNLNITLRELEMEHENLKLINRELITKLDDYHQQLYEMKRQLSNSKSMELHWMSEVENLQSSDRTECVKLLKRISDLEAELTKTKELHSDTVQSFEKEMQNKEKEIDELKEQMKSQINSQSKRGSDEIDKCNEEIYDLRTNIETLNNLVAEYEIKYKSISVENINLKQENNELVRNCDELKQCLQTKTEQLVESNDIVNNLQDEVIVLKGEINELKSTPVDKTSKGNSLFAEVHDSRQQLIKFTNNLKKSYNDLKHVCISKTKELELVRSEHAVLMKKTEDIKNNSSDKSRLEDVYKEYIERLETNIKNLEKELKMWTDLDGKFTPANNKGMQSILKLTREEVFSLQKELENENLLRVMSEQSLYETKVELRKWEKEALLLRTENSKLNNQLEEHKLRVPIPDEETIEEPPENKMNSPPKQFSLYNTEKKLDTSYGDRIPPSKLKMAADLENCFLHENSFEDIDDFVAFNMYQRPMTDNASNILARLNYRDSIGFSGISEHDDCKENSAQEKQQKIINAKSKLEKRVGFVDVDVAEKQPTRKPTRGKVLVTPCVHIPSINKNK